MAGPGFEYIGKEEKKFVLKVLKSKELNRYHFDSEPKKDELFVKNFENKFSKTIGSKYCIAMNSCTSALLASLKALSIGSGDEVLVPGYTFVATASAVVLAGAKPIFCEIDDSLMIDPNQLDKFCTKNTKAIICVHMLGRPCNMKKILKFAKSKGLYVIEDVAQACGATYKGKRLGSFGEAGCFSFNIFKIITAGDGGCLTTNSPELFSKAFAFHDHGFVPDKTRVINEDSIVGTNLRMTELGAAVLIAQLSKLNKILTKIRSNKLLLVKNIKLPAYAKLIPSNDPEGETGTAIVLKFDNSSLASKFCKDIKTKVLSDSGRHYYKNMISIIGREKPFTKNSSIPKPLTHTDDILSRSVLIGNGILDNYLGAGVGVKVTAKRKDIYKLASKINNVLRNMHD